MNISINVNYFRKRRNGLSPRPIDECIRLCTDAGFKVLDYSIDAWAENWEEQVDRTMNAAAKYGAVIEQSHAPFNFYKRRPREVFDAAVNRSVDAAIKMGVKTLVFHADEYRPTEENPFDFDKGLNQIYDFLAPHLEKVTAGGVRAALENVFDDMTLKPVKGQRFHFCADVEELIAIIDKFNSPMVGCCWDSGHGKIAAGNEGHVDLIRRLGSRIICTHLHDNYYDRDLHLEPFRGDANWEEIMPALRATGYSGSLTFELGYGCMHEDLLDSWLKQLYHTGEILRDMFGSEK